MNIDDLKTIEEAKQYIKDMLLDNERCSCPVCESTVGRYRRKVSKGQVYFLIKLFKEYQRTKLVWHFYTPIKDWVTTKHKRNVSDYSKLKSWGLIGSKGDYDDDGKSTGYFCISKKGIAFLDGKIEIPKYLYQTSKGVTFAVSPETVRIDDYFDDFSLTDLTDF